MNFFKNNFCLGGIEKVPLYEAILTDEKIPLNVMKDFL